MSPSQEIFSLPINSWLSSILFHRCTCTLLEFHRTFAKFSHPFFILFCRRWRGMSSQVTWQEEWSGLGFWRSSEDSEVLCQSELTWTIHRKTISQMVTFNSAADHSNWLRPLFLPKMQRLSSIPAAQKLEKHQQQLPSLMLGAQISSLLRFWRQFGSICDGFPDSVGGLLVFAGKLFLPDSVFRFNLSSLLNPFVSCRGNVSLVYCSTAANQRNLFQVWTFAICFIAQSSSSTEKLSVQNPTIKVIFWNPTKISYQVPTHPKAPQSHIFWRCLYHHTLAGDRSKSSNRNCTPQTPSIQSGLKKSQNPLESLLNQKTSPHRTTPTNPHLNSNQHSVKKRLFSEELHLLRRDFDRATLGELLFQFLAAKALNLPPTWQLPHTTHQRIFRLNPLITVDRTPISHHPYLFLPKQITSWSRVLLQSQRQLLCWVRPQRGEHQLRHRQRQRQAREPPAEAEAPGIAEAHSSHGEA